MKLYELSYLMSADLPEEEAKELQEKVNNFIIENQGALDRIEDIVKKRLPAPIKNQTMVFLGTMNFYLKPENIFALKEKVKSEAKIFKFIILNKKPRSAAETPIRIKNAKILETPLRAPEKTKKVEIEEIEKKLEEILGE